MAKAPTADQIRKEITERMVQAVKTGRPPWRQPWGVSDIGGLPCNFASGRRYTGINPLILMLTSLAYDYTSRYWGTGNSWLSDLGCHVRKGEKSTHVTLFRFLPVKDAKGNVVKDDKGKDKKFPLMRFFPVFNASQVQAPAVEVLLDGRGTYGIVKALLGQHDKVNRKAVTTKAELMAIAQKYLPADDQPKASDTREMMARRISTGIAAKLAKYTVGNERKNDVADFGPAEEFVRATGADIRFGGGRASYIPADDYIKCPVRTRFESTAAYYETLFHELVHWTEKADRVGRKEGHTYAFGELVAEIGACFLLTELGVPMADKMLPNSECYVNTWLEGMGKDPKFIFDASTQAGKAVDFLLAKVGKQNPKYEGEETEDADGPKELGQAA